MKTQSLLKSESLKLRLERINRLADSDYQTIQRFYKGQLTIAEAYSEGVIFLHVHLFSLKGEFKISRESTPVNRDGPRYLGLQHNQMPVLVWIRDVAQGLRPLNSLVRLQPLNCPDVIVAKATKVRIPSPLVKRVGVVLNRELGSILDRFAVENCQLVDDVIERGPEIVNAIADNETEAQGNNERTIKGYDQILRRTRIVLEGNFVYVGLPEVHMHLTQFVKVFYCPFYPEGSPIERM